MSIWPKNFHRHDAQWLQEQLSKLPIELKRRAVDGYDTVWQEAWHAEPVTHKRENKARFAANTRLRKYVERVTSARKMSSITHRWCIYKQADGTEKRHLGRYEATRNGLKWIKWVSQSDAVSSAEANANEPIYKDNYN